MEGEDLNLRLSINGSDHEAEISRIFESMSSLKIYEEKEQEKQGNNILKKEKKDKYQDFIKYLKSNQINKLAFMVGAGISTAAGIPDFRSENGLFNQIKKKYKIFLPELLFDTEVFLKNPEIFYEFCRNFHVESYNPTIFHVIYSKLIFSISWDFYVKKNWSEQYLPKILMD